MKTRHEVPQGLLDRRHSASKFQLARYDPTDGELASFISHYWFVSWDLTREPPYVSENLPYPNVHLVFQHGLSGVFGPTRRKFVRRLEGKDRAFGVSFKPGGFFALVQDPVHRFTDRRTPLDKVFGQEGLELEAAILATNDEAQQIGLAEAFVRGRNPRHDARIDQASQIVDLIAGNRSLIKVEDVAREVAVSPRYLERLFRRYVGVSPKWVVQRYRLFEAADRLVAEPDLNSARLAQQLGYCDQAHFIKDFKAMVGCSPAEYARAAS